MKAPVLNTKRLIIKPLTLEQLSQEYIDWLNDEDVIKFLETGGQYTFQMLEEYLTNVENQDIYFWAIHMKANGLHIGNIKIDPINHLHSHAEYGIMMGRKTEWGKGFAEESTRKIIEFCFNEVNIRKLTLGVVEDNLPAVNLYNKLGFEIEGVYKKHRIYQGKYCNIIRMALFNPSYRYDE